MVSPIPSMTTATRIALGLGLLLLATAVCPPDGAAQNLTDTSVLVFSKTNGYRHAAIPDGIQMILELGQEHGFEVTATEDTTVFRADSLSAFDVVVFLNTSGNIVDPTGQRVVREFIQNGGGYVGIHSASAGEYDWDWYGRLVGAFFDDHPEIQRATVRVEHPNHPSTDMLPAEWERRDEWYNFRSNPRDSVQVLLTLDESTYQGGTMGADHPIAWCHEFNGGRSWYTALGHTKASYDSALYRQHVLGGLQWAAGSSNAE